MSCHIVTRSKIRKKKKNVSFSSQIMWKAKMVFKVSFERYNIDTLNVVTCADNSKDNIWLNKQVSGFICRLSSVTCHMSVTPTATATDPPPANSPTMHRRIDDKDLQIFFFPGQFKTISDPKWQILKPLPFNYFYVRNLFVQHTTYIVSRSLQFID